MFRREPTSEGETQVSKARPGPPTQHLGVAFFDRTKRSGEVSSSLFNYRGKPMRRLRAAKRGSAWRPSRRESVVR